MKLGRASYNSGASTPQIARDTDLTHLLGIWNIDPPNILCTKYPSDNRPITIYVPLGPYHRFKDKWRHFNFFLGGKFYFYFSMPPDY